MSILFVDTRSAMIARTTGWERYARAIIAGLRLRDDCDIRFGNISVSAAPQRMLSDWISVPIASRGCAATHFLTFPPVPTARYRTLPLYTLYDLTWWRFPSTSSYLGRLYYRPLAAQHLKRRYPVFTISKSVRDELIGDWSYSADDVFVVPPELDPVFLADAVQSQGLLPRRSSHEIDGPYVLAVATIEPRKNLGRLLQAWTSSGMWRSHTLAIVGRRRSDTKFDFDQSMVRWLGSIEDGELARLYREADAVVVPSLYEGFGLPILEALCLRTEVLCSDLAVFREVAGANATYFDPYDVDSIAEALLGLWNKPPGPAISSAVSTSYSQTFAPGSSAKAQIAGYRHFGLRI